MEIIDSQVHVWTENTAQQPWDRPWDEQAQREYEAGASRTGRALGAEALLDEMHAAGVNRAVLVPPGFVGDRNDYAVSCAQRYPEAFAVMGRLDLRTPKSEGEIRRDIERAGMLGYRLTFLTDDLRGLLVDAHLDWFWQIAASLGIPVTLIAPGLLAAVAAAAQRFPSLRLSVDHFNLPSTVPRDEVGQRLAQLCELGRLPNVAVKASALPGFASDPYPFESLHGHILEIVEAFGPERVFWGTDLSRLPITCSYRQAVTFFTEELDFLSGGDLEWIMGRGVKRWFGWSV